MRKNVLISGFFNEAGIEIAKLYKANGYYIYGTDVKEDYEGVCDRAFRFDIRQFASDADYRIRFTQIFDEVIPNLNTLIICTGLDGKEALKDIQLDHWHDSLNSNLTGPMLLIKLFQSKLNTSKGSIIGIGPLSEKKVDGEFVSAKVSISGFIGLIKSISFDPKATFTAGYIETKRSINPKELHSNNKEIAKVALFISESNIESLNGKIIKMN